ncbi:MAG: alpha/beta fold hydrolase [Acidobacteria bacterium]|nr:alpha/beta fold hydrolase [Acidobacteriota bacterium]
MDDALLETAITNWAPRFTANGVDASDFARITSSLASWDDWCEGWSRGAQIHLDLAESALNDDRHLSAGEHFARAATYFHFAKFLFVHDPGQARAAHERAVTALTRALPLLSPAARREQIDFDGTRLVGVLRVPDAPGPHPTVLLIAGLDSTKEEFRDVERSFLDRGLATFALDGPGQGEVEWTLPIRPDWDGVGDAVISHLQTLPEVDPARIGVWGVSLGGYYAARLAASDLPIRATVSLSGPYSLGATWDNLNPLTRRAFEVRSHSADAAEARRRAFDLNLEGLATRINTPLLVIMGRRDRLFPWTDAQRLVEESTGPSELLLLEDANHGCANVVSHHRPYSADWMARQLHAPGSLSRTR